MGRALFELIRFLFELIRFLFKQRWFQQLFYWLSIVVLASGFFIIAISFFSDPEFLSEYIFSLLLSYGLWGLIAFLLRRQLKKDQ